MALLKYIERIKRMDQLIRMKATGNAAAFAEKMGLSRSVLMEYLSELKSMGAPIMYCSERQSYYYQQDCKLILDFQPKEQEKIKGGINFLNYFGQSEYTGLVAINIAM